MVTVEPFQSHMFRIKHSGLFLARSTFPGHFYYNVVPGCTGSLWSFSGPLSVAEGAEPGRDV